ncbi:TetR/AcrR family transcriptional regulator [Streptomyces olivochromogenes]|uniref:TetR family transcriptional regulator n=1 Tax=Streptomyces olivochromogenes TaxID=1963 RepID=A0A250V3T2_STROL|nr:TetR family transcriptional regulator [Streptomyces olivochromogenes]KUN48895.1 TetR family transcriptional regulator [Streptomyces olivochromogenes]GAX48847.1 TetR family transcriptional regulator [Streptomyces olivochromogenes]
MAARTVRAEQVSATRGSILTAAERLYAEQGVYAVSNRQVSEAAGQGNNAAVGYHFGTRADLVRAIVRKHFVRIEQVRLRLLAEIDEENADIRDWVACLVRPLTEHLAELGRPSWYARFTAQVMTDPALRRIVIDETLSSPSLRMVLERLHRCLSDLPVEVHAERSDMARELMVHMCAERERALADNTPTPRSSWHDTALGLTDAVVALWLAPITPCPRRQRGEICRD